MGSWYDDLIPGKRFVDAVNEVAQQGDDLETINQYIMYTPLKTKAAEAARDKWVVWYDGLNWVERNAGTATFDRARNLRNEFNLANASTSEEKTQVENVLKTGITSEEAEGGTRRALTSGFYNVPTFSDSTKLGIVALVGVVGLAWLGKKVYLDPVLKRVR